MKRVMDHGDFLVLSAAIHYQLMGRSPNLDTVLALVLDEQGLADEDRVLGATLGYITEAYGDRRRRLGTLAVTHPIRTAALLRRLAPAVSTNSDRKRLALSMLHDKAEDLVASHYTPEVWDRLESRYHSLLDLIDPSWRIAGLVEALTRRPGERYPEYLLRVLEAAEGDVSVLEVKLADRVDNSYDLKIDIQLDTADVDGFELLFDIMFTDSHVGAGRSLGPPPRRRIDGSQRLMVCFKSLEFLNILRRRRADNLSASVSTLFQTLARVSLKQSLDVLINIFVHHITDIPAQQAILDSAMAYCRTDRISCITSPDGDHPLDGYLKRWFDHDDKDLLEQRLAELYRRKPDMALGAVAFASVFSSYLSNPGWAIDGVDESGVRATTSCAPRL